MQLLVRIIQDIYIQYDLKFVEIDYHSKLPRSHIAMPNAQRDSNDYIVLNPSRLLSYYCFPGLAIKMTLFKMIQVYSLINWSIIDWFFPPYEWTKF